MRRVILKRCLWEYFFEARDDARTFTVTQLVEQRFDKDARGLSIIGVEIMGQFPQTLAGVIKVQRLGCAAKTIFDQGPQPDGPIDDDEDFLQPEPYRNAAPPFAR